MKVVKRLGLAAEIKLCHEFLSNPDNTKPAELFSRINVHQNMMRSMTAKGSLYQSDRAMAELDSFIFDKKENNPKLDKAKKDFTKLYKNLVDPKAYNDTVSMEYVRSGIAAFEDKTPLVIKAITQNKSLDAVKRAEAKKADSSNKAKVATEEKKEIINADDIVELH